MTIDKVNGHGHKIFLSSLGHPNPHQNTGKEKKKEKKKPKLDLQIITLYSAQISEEKLIPVKKTSLTHLS